MKKIIFISIILVAFFHKNGNAQLPGVPDTLVYLQQIAANKTQYIGRPFHELTDTMKIQIKFFSPFAGKVYDKSKETSTSFAFYFPETEDEMYLAYPMLKVYWQLPLNANQSIVLYKNHNGGGGGSPTVSSFYANAIIADIRVRE